jgi:hypothetical protein
MHNYDEDIFGCLSMWGYFPLSLTPQFIGKVEVKLKP